MADDKLPPFERWLARASRLLSAVADFLMYLAAVMRQLVHLAGWVVLLVGCVELLVSPHLTTAHLAVPGVGALAVLQSLVKPWWRHELLPPREPLSPSAQEQAQGHKPGG